MLPQFVGWLLSGMIYLLNYVVGMVKHLPLSGIDNIYTSLPMVFLIYIFMVLTFVMLNKKNLVMLLPVILVLAIIIGLKTYHQYIILNQKKVVIYSINNYSTYDFIDGKDHVLITDSILSNEESKMDYHLKNSRIQWGIDNISHTKPENDTSLNNLLYSSGNFMYFNNIRIFINNGTKQYYPTKSKLALDMVIISGRKSTDLDQLLLVFDFSRVIIDSSVPYWDQKVISETAGKYGISCYNVKTDGAFVVEL